MLDLELGDPVVVVGTALDHDARDLPDLAQVRLDPAGAVLFSLKGRTPKYVFSFETQKWAH